MDITNFLYFLAFILGLYAVNNSSYWLSTPIGRNYDNSGGTGYAYHNGSDYGALERASGDSYHGLRPVVCLKASTLAHAGTGTQTNIVLD